MSAQEGSLSSILLALGANGLIGLMKLGAAIFTGSGAMMAEAVHSFADCGNQGLLLIGLKRAKRPPSPEFPLGFGRSIYFSSFIVAIMLFTLGGVFSIYEGIHKLQQPTTLESPGLALGILAASIVLEAISLRGCLKAVNRERGDRSLLRWFRESRSSELIVVFGEDIAALLGLVLAFAAVVVTLITGDPMFDALGSVGIGVLLVIVAAAVGVEVKNLLIGQSVEAHKRQAIHEFVSGHPCVKRVLDIITLQLGHEVMVAIKAELHEAGSVKIAVDRINDCERMLKERFPEVKWIFFEPDVE